MTAWSVHPLPADGKPATAVCIHADDATVREGVVELARIMTAAQWAELRMRVQCYDDHVAEFGHESAETCRLAMDDLLDEVSRAHGSDLSGLWRVRVGVGELPSFHTAIRRAAQQSTVREGGAA